MTIGDTQRQELRMGLQKSLGKEVARLLMDSLPDDYARTVTRLDENIGELRRDVARLEKKMDDRFTAIDNRFAAIDTRFAALDDRFAAVNMRLGTIDDRLNVLDGRMKLMVGTTMAFGSGIIALLVQLVISSPST